MQTPERLSHPVYHDEDAARLYLEQNRWPEFVVCPLCGSPEKISRPSGSPSAWPRLLELRRRARERRAAG